MIKNFVFSLFLLLIAATVSFAGEVERGTISGRWITKSNGPMTGAQVLLFNLAVGPPPSSDKFLRVPDAVTTVDNEGRFSVLVPEGSYYLVMRKRVDGAAAGPPRDGDLQYYSRDKKGKARFYTVKADGETEIGTISEATVFHKVPIKYEKGMTAIEGTVTDEDGKPVEGARVFVFASPEMNGRPQYASEATGKDGRYIVKVNKKGTYYLKARSHYGGGKPQAGEFMGGYGEPSAPTAVKVKQGELRKGIDIQTGKFPGRGERE